MKPKKEVKLTNEEMEQVVGGEYSRTDVYPNCRRIITGTKETIEAHIASCTG